MIRHPDNKFNVGDWITPNPDFLPSGVHDGRLTVGKSYLVLAHSNEPSNMRWSYRITCDNGTTNGWLGKCWISGKCPAYLPDPDFTLDEIHAAQEVYERVK